MGIELHYFPLRGRAEMCRLALALSGEDWTQPPVAYPSIKTETSPFKFCTAPMLKDGDLVLCQSHAILNHIGRSYSLYGATARESALVDEAVDALLTGKDKYDELVASALDESTKAEYFFTHCDPASAYGIRNGGWHWTYIAKLFKANCADGRGFIVGAAPSIADCLLFEMLDIHMRLFSDGALAKNYPELVAAHGHFEQLPRIADYISNRRHSKVNANGLG